MGHSDDVVTGLAAGLSQPLGRLHAVVDGAHFGNLPESLQQADLDFRPLYHGKNSAAGPHVVHPRNPAEVESILDVVGDLPAAVWWDWPDDILEADAAIYQHLRRLGMIEVPADALPPNRVEPKALALEYRQILFRHADPRVLTIVLPELSTEQWQQLMGLAYRLIFVDPEAGLQIAPHPDIVEL